MPAHILISGGSGFIGRNLVEQLSDKYHLHSPNHQQLDLTDEQQIALFFKFNQVDVIIHCAGVGATKKTSSLPNIVESNLKMFLNLLKFKKHYQKMIFLGSGAEYNKKYDLKQVNENYFGKHIPQDSYGFSKYLCSKIIDDETKTINLRLFGVFGKYEDYHNRFISYAICQALTNSPIIIRQNVFFDYLYVDDLVKIIEHFINHSTKHKFINVGRGRAIDLQSLAKIIVQLTSTNVPIIIENPKLANEYTCDTTRLKRIIGNFSYTDIHQSISNLINYYQQII